MNTFQDPINHLNINLHPISSLQKHYQIKNSLKQSSINNSNFNQISTNNHPVNSSINSHPVNKFTSNHPANQTEINDYKQLYLKQKQKTKKLINIQQTTNILIQNTKNSKINQQMIIYQQKIKQMQINCQSYQKILQQLENQLQYQAHICQRKKVLQVQSKLFLEEQNKILKEELQQKNKIISLLKSKPRIQKYTIIQKENSYASGQQQLQITKTELQALMTKLQDISLSNQQLKKIQQIYYKQRDQCNDQINRLNKHITSLSSNNQTQLNFYKSKLQQLTQELVRQRSLKHQLKQFSQQIQNENNLLLQHLSQLQCQNISIKAKAERYQKEIQRFQIQQNQIYCQLQKSRLEIQELKISKANMLQQIKWYKSLLQQTKSNYINSQLEKQLISSKLKKQNLQKSKRTPRSVNNLNESAISYNHKLSQSNFTNCLQQNQSLASIINKQNLFKQTNLQSTSSDLQKPKKQQIWPAFYKKTSNKLKGKGNKQK